MDSKMPREPDSSSRVSILLVAFALLLVSALHYGTPRGASYHALHDVWRRLYYVPIVLGAFHYGLKGGVLTALAATLLYLPHVLFQWGGMAGGNQYLEIIMFNVIGLVTGTLAGELRAKREEARVAYERLAASFERTKEAERLAAMGQLSASLAHEIRNPLASLKGSLPIITEGIPQDDSRQEFVQIVEKEIRRLEGLTGQFLNYAKPPSPAWAKDDLDAVVQGVVRLVEKQAQRHQVEIETLLAQDLPLSRMDSSRMRQVVLNLALNAIEAMPEGGVLRFTTKLEAAAPVARASHSKTTGAHELSAGTLLLVVEDTGPGIEAKIRAHLFEPFVTTKERGTGLGLAVVYQCVKLHGGTIEVAESAEGGARFTIRLPLHSDEPAAEV
jgi:signal transduction histidine kinase